MSRSSRSRRTRWTRRFPRPRTGCWPRSSLPKGRRCRCRRWSLGLRPKRALRLAAGRRLQRMRRPQDQNALRQPRRWRAAPVHRRRDLQARQRPPPPLSNLTPPRPPALILPPHRVPLHYSLTAATPSRSGSVPNPPRSYARSPRSMALSSARCRGRESRDASPSATSSSSSSPARPGNAGGCSPLDARAERRRDVRAGARGNGG